MILLGCGPAGGVDAGSQRDAAHAEDGGEDAGHAHDAGSGMDARVATDAGADASILDEGDPPTFGDRPAPLGYEVVWADEFDGTSVDASLWNVLDSSNYGSSNHEDECYFARNATVSGGQLHLEARRETVHCGSNNPDTGDDTYYFTSAFLTTRAQGGPLRYKFRYGYVEASIRMPKGNPYWGALWLVSAGDGSAPAWPEYGEFDITELYGVRPDMTTGTFHWACTGRSQCQSSPNIFNLATGDSYGGSSNFGQQLLPENYDSFDGVSSSRFVRYGFLWEPDRITWYVDGHPYRYFDGEDLVRIRPDGTEEREKTLGVELYPDNAPARPMSEVFAFEHSIDLNLAIGGGGPQYLGYTGEDSAAGFSDGNLAAELPASMDVDWVRVYQLP